MDVKMRFLICTIQFTCCFVLVRTKDGARQELVNFTRGQSIANQSPLFCQVITYSHVEK